MFAALLRISEVCSWQLQNNLNKQNQTKTQQCVMCYFPNYLVLLLPHPSPQEALRAARVPFLEGTMQDAPEHTWLQRNLQCRPSPPPPLFLLMLPPPVSLLLFLVDLFVLGPLPHPPAPGSCTHTGAFGADLAG